MDGGDLKFEVLLGVVERFLNSPCPRCALELCGHDVLIATAMGFKTRPICRICLAKGVGLSREELDGRMDRYVASKDCYRGAWNESSRREMIRRGAAPCSATVISNPLTSAFVNSDPTPTMIEDAQLAGVFDFDDLSCGDLVLELRVKLQELAPKVKVLVRATDPGAREDLPAWCGLTGHKLLAMDPPYFWIQKREK